MKSLFQKFKNVFSFPKFRIVEKLNGLDERFFIAQVKTGFFEMWSNLYYHEKLEIILPGFDSLKEGWYNKKQTAEGVISAYKLQLVEVEKHQKKEQERLKQQEFKTIKITNA